MSKTLADMDMAKAGQILSQCGSAVMYDYMESFGDKYAAVANGVARGGSLSGNAALRHMRTIAERSGKTFSEQNADKLRLDMAEAYLRVRNHKGEAGDHTQLRAGDAQTFHRSVFRDNNLPEKACTLETPFALRGDRGREDLWKDILGAAGNQGREVAVSAKVFLKIFAIQQDFSQKIAYNPLGGIFSPDTYKRDIETLYDTTEWLGTNISFENFKESLFDPEQPESTPETLECVIDPPATDTEPLTPALTPVVFREPADSIKSVQEITSPAPLPLIGESLKKNFAYSRSATTTAPTNAIHRLLIAHTPLGDALWAVSLTGREAHRYNLAGIGWGDPNTWRSLAGEAVANLHAPGQPVEATNNDATAPVALSALARHWLPRCQYAGTYDAVWRRDVAPFLPENFDEKFFQCAPPDQQIAYPTGGEFVTLTNLLPQHPSLRFVLPRFDALKVRILRSDYSTETLSPPIDTLYFETEAGRFSAVWRTSTPIRRRSHEFHTIVVGQVDPAWWQARSLGLDDAHCPGCGPKDDAL